MQIMSYMSKRLVTSPIASFVCGLSGSFLFSPPLDIHVHVRYCTALSSEKANTSKLLTYIRPKKYICVFQVSRPYLALAKCCQICWKMVKKCIEKCNFYMYMYIKYFDKIKCYADRPYLVFLELKPETHIYFWLNESRPEASS